jgi:hypothetical protein
MITQYPKLDITTTRNFITDTQYTFKEVCEKIGITTAFGTYILQNGSESPLIAF